MAVTYTPDAESQAVQAKADVLERLLQPEVQESLTTLVDNLPKLTEMVTFLTKAYDFASTVATDRVLIEDFAGGIKEFMHPVTTKVKGVAAAAIEAKERAETDPSTIGVFGLLRMMKDPQTQKTLKFMNAFLHVMAEQKQQEK